MHHRFPQYRVARRTPYEVEFVGDLQAKSTFPVYTVSITYRGESTPLVKVLKPQLVASPPHFYENEHALCLYHKNNFKWRKEMLIAGTIVPWTAAWLYFYEFWLQDGKWYGPEVDHSQIADTLD